MEIIKNKFDELGIQYEEINGSIRVAMDTGPSVDTYSTLKELLSNDKQFEDHFLNDFIHLGQLAPQNSKPNEYYWLITPKPDHLKNKQSICKD